MTTYLETLLDVEKFKCKDKYFPLVTNYNDQLDKEITMDLKQQRKANEIVQPLRLSGLMKKKIIEDKAKILNDGWYGMTLKEPSAEEKDNYLLLKLKKYMDPKNPAKKQEIQKMPKYFQIGTMIDAGDTQGGLAKIPRGKRSQTLADQFLELDKETNYSKRKFKEIQGRHQAVGLNKKLKKAKLLNKRFKKKK